MTALRRVVWLIAFGCLISTRIHAEPPKRMTVDECESYAVDAAWHSLPGGDEIAADNLRAAFKRSRTQVEPAWQRAAKAAGWTPPRLKGGK